VALLGIAMLACCGRPSDTVDGAPEVSPVTTDDPQAKVTVMTDQQWKDKLTPEQYHVTRKKGTERAFTGEYWDHKGDGVYLCVCCEARLFHSETKFDSGSGWPSFWKPVDPDNVRMEGDDSLGMKRTEVVCSACDAHLGHVFEDGPEPTGLRYCINSVSLRFQEAQDDTPQGTPQANPAQDNAKDK